MKGIMGINENVESNAGEQEFDSILSSVGIQLTPEEKSEIQPDCPVELPQQHSDVMGQLESAVNNINDKGQLKSLLKQVLSMKRTQNVQEQGAAAGVLIAGVSVPPVALTIAIGFVALLIVLKLGKLLFGGGTRVRQNPDCRRKHRLYRRFGIGGVVNEDDMSQQLRTSRTTDYPDYHGSPYDRGQADSYYGRAKDPHYYPEGSYQGERITDLTDDELEAYHAGYDDNEMSGAKKDWGE